MRWSITKRIGRGAATPMISASTKLTWLQATVLERMVGRPAAPLVDEVLGVVRRDLPAGYPWPGNVRELEQCVRRVLMTRHYAGDRAPLGADEGRRLHRAIDTGELPARELVSGYCRLLYRRHGTYEEVAGRAGLDRRTVKRHVDGSSECP